MPDENRRVDVPPTASSSPVDADAGKPPALKIFKAAVKNDFELLKIAVAEGADVNGVNPLGKTPLELGVFHGNTEMVRWLFDHGARLPENSYQGRTLWIPARAKRLSEIEALLIKHGAKPRLLDWITVFVYRRKMRQKEAAAKS